jgi:hypothetical protein
LGGKLLLDGSGLGSAYTGSQQHGSVVVDKFGHGRERCRLTELVA